MVTTYKPKGETRLWLPMMSGIIALAVAMGIGRFAYTPILPLMQRDALLSEAAAGYLASSNYLGYFLGALFTRTIRKKLTWQTILRLGLLMSISTTIGMGIIPGYSIWILLRFLSGVASGFVFVSISNIVFDILASHGRMSWAGLFYTGVGLGIVFTGLSIPPLAGRFGWQGAWVGLGIISTLIVVLVWIGIQEEEPAPKQSPSSSEDLHTSRNGGALSWLIGAYACEGFGYIISGTFLVAMVERMGGMGGLGATSWVLVGLAAIPSSIVWGWISIRTGSIRALIVAYAAQALGVALPVIYPNPIGVFTGAILFGATFIGIPTVALSAAREMEPGSHGHVIGKLTAVYAIGQMLGPAFAGVVATRSGYEIPLLTASAVILIGMGMLIVGNNRTRVVTA